MSDFKHRILTPGILKAACLHQETKVFLCGPGARHGEYDFREKIKDYLKSIPGIKVVYGEELDHKVVRTRRADLQTLESTFAQSVDFTILLPDSPGSIAELGTFSMIPSVRSRLFVLMKATYFGADSYIARGPLSLIAKTGVSRVIYLRNRDTIEIERVLNIPIMLYKFSAYEGGRQYRAVSRDYYRSRSGYRDEYYGEYMEPMIKSFYDSITYAAIWCVEGVRFGGLAQALVLPPGELRASLRRLFQAQRITKDRSGRYAVTEGLRSELLSAFSTTQMSRAKALAVAYA